MFLFTCLKLRTHSRNYRFAKGVEKITRARSFLRNSLLSADSPCACALIARMEFSSDFIIQSNSLKKRFGLQE